MVNIVHLNGAVPERELFELVLAGVKLEHDGLFETSHMAGWPQPIPQILIGIKERLALWESLEFPFQVFPHGWDSFTPEEVHHTASTA